MYPMMGQAVYGQPTPPMGYPQQMQAQQAQQMAQPQRMPSYVCKPVTGREEALAMQVDFFGPGTVMPDIAHDTIYLKRFDTNTGASVFCEYRRVQPAPEPAPVQFVPVEVFEALAARVQKLEGGQTNDPNE